MYITRSACAYAEIFISVCGTALKIPDKRAVAVKLDFPNEMKCLYTYIEIPPCIDKMRILNFFRLPGGFTPISMDEGLRGAEHSESTRRNGSENPRTINGIHDGRMKFSKDGGRGREGERGIRFIRSMALRGRAT